ncbi:MAG: aspartate carbamoyltransferase, partial [Rhodospirillaceae bacterium]
MDSFIKTAVETPWRRAVISVDQFSRADIDEIFDLADRLSTGRTTPLGGKIIANVFYEPSTRTSSSFFSAMTRLGGSVIPINEVNYSSVTKGESLEDTIRTLENYCDLVVLRHFENDATERAMAVSKIPIINAGNGSGEHPTQALLDLYTIKKEHGGVDELTISLMGDLKFGRTVHSLTKLLRMYDCKLQFVAPSQLAMPDEYIWPADNIYEDLNEAIESSDVLYVTRVQKERMQGSEDFDFSYAVTSVHRTVAKKKMG